MRLRSDVSEPLHGSAPAPFRMALAVAGAALFLSAPAGVAGAGAGAGSAVRGASVKVASAAEAPPQLTNALAGAREVLRRARVREDDHRQLPGWGRVGELEAMVADIEGLRAAGNHAAAFERAVSSRFAQARESVVNEVLEATPYLIIGPFGNAAWTDADAPTQPPTLVTAEALRPFVGETDGTNWDRCAEDFRPDPTRPYAGYGGEVRWKRAVKTDRLSLDAVAAPYPLWMVAYAYTEIYSPAARDISLSVKTEFGGPPMTWVGGRMVTSPLRANPPPTATLAVGPYEGLIHAQLAQGWNPVLLRMPVRKGMRFVVTPLKRDPGPDPLRHVYTPMDDVRFRVPGGA